MQRSRSRSSARPQAGTFNSLGPTSLSVSFLPSLQRSGSFTAMRTLLQAGSGGRMPVPPETRFLTGWRMRQRCVLFSVAGSLVLALRGPAPGSMGQDGVSIEDTKAITINDPILASTGEYVFALPLASFDGPLGWTLLLRHSPRYLNRPDYHYEYGAGFDHNLPRCCMQGTHRDGRGRVPSLRRAGVPPAGRRTRGRAGLDEHRGQRARPGCGPPPRTLRHPHVAQLPHRGHAPAGPLTRAPGWLSQNRCRGRTCCRRRRDTATPPSASSSNAMAAGSGTTVSVMSLPVPPS